MQQTVETQGYIYTTKGLTLTSTLSVPWKHAWLAIYSVSGHIPIKHTFNNVVWYGNYLCPSCDIASSDPWIDILMLQYIIMNVPYMAIAEFGMESCQIWWMLIFNCYHQYFTHQLRSYSSDYNYSIHLTPRKLPT